MSPSNICKLCNKSAKTNIVQCSKCEQWMHKFCCDQKKIAIINGLSKCCDEDFADTMDMDDSILKTTEGRLRKEIIYLKLLLNEKNQIIADKCTIIKDKEAIIELLHTKNKVGNENNKSNAANENPNASNRHVKSASMSNINDDKSTSNNNSKVTMAKKI